MLSISRILSFVSLILLALSTNASPQDNVIFHDTFMEIDRQPVTETTGRAFKGPFQIGSGVTLAVLNDSLQQTGTQYSGVVNTNNGQYRVSAEIPDAPIEMIVNGFFFDEITNEISSTQIELRAITQSDSLVNINLLTALEAERVRTLVSNGLSFSDAKSQAVSEIMGFFGFDPGTVDSTKIELNSEDGKALLAITAILMTNADGTPRSINELQGLITQLTDDVADGALSSTFRTLIVQSAKAVDATAFRNNLAGYFSDIGNPATVPTFDSALETALSESAYKVLVSANTGGTVSSLGTNWVMQGDSLTITISASAGYSLDDVTSNCTGSINDTSTAFIIPSANADCTLAVEFTANQYTITFVSDGGNEITPITADFGSTIPNIPAPTRAGYTFLGWDSPVPETMPAGDLTLTATWKTSDAAQLLVDVQPSGGVSGTPLSQQPTITLVDADGNAPGNEATVTVTVKQGSGALLGNLSVLSTDGTATFDALQLDIADSYILTFSVANLGLSVDSNSFDVTAGPASKLLFRTEANGARSGLTFSTQPSLAIVDAAGNTISDASNSVTISTQDATLIGNATASASAGIVTYTDLGLSGLVDEYQLTATADGLTSATQTINLDAGDPSQLGFVRQADGVGNGVIIATQPIVEIRDASGNRVEAENGAITLSTTDGGLSITRGGSAQVVAGVAEFTEATISAAEGTYNLTYSYGDAISSTQQITVAKTTSGLLSADETWSGTVVLSNSFRIPSDRTLTISPGTQILIDNFDSSSRQILVEGIIMADASAGEPITFNVRFPTGNKNDWLGIRFRNTQKTSADGNGLNSGSSIDNVVIQNADTGIYVYNQGAAISNSVFRNNRRAIELRKTNGVYIADSEFIENTHGIWTEYEVYGEADTYGDVINTWILNNKFISNQIGAEFNINQRSTDNLIVTGNWFEDNYSGFRWGGGGYGIREANPMEINNNTFWANGDAIFMQAYSSGDFDIEIDGNSFGDNTNAMLLSHGFDTLNITNNFYYGNDRTISVVANWLYVTFDNNLIHEDGEFLVVSDRGSSSTRDITLTNNVINKTEGYILSLDGRITEFDFSNNVVTDSLSDSIWFRNVSTTSIEPTSNFVDWGGNSPTSKIYDMNDDFEVGEILFSSPLSSAGQSTTTRSVSEVSALISAFADGMDVADRKGPRQQ